MRRYVMNPYIDRYGYQEETTADFPSTEKSTFSVARRKATRIHDDNDGDINLPDCEPLGWAEP